MKIEDILNAQMNAEGYGYENHDGDVIVIDQETAEEVLESIEENLGALEAQAEVVEELKEDLEEVREVIDSGTTEGQQAAESFLDKMAMFYNATGASAGRPVRLSKESLGSHLSNADDMMSVLNQSAEGFWDAIKNAWEKFTAWLKRMVESIGRFAAKMWDKFTGLFKNESAMAKVNKKGVEFANDSFDKVKDLGGKVAGASAPIFSAIKDAFTKAKVEKTKDAKGRTVTTITEAGVAMRAGEEAVNFVKKGWAAAKDAALEKLVVREAKRQVEAGKSKWQQAKDMVAKLVGTVEKGGNETMAAAKSAGEAGAGAGGAAANKASAMYRKAVANIVTMYNKGVQAMGGSVKAGGAAEE